MQARRWRTRLLGQTFATQQPQLSYEANTVQAYLPAIVQSVWRHRSLILVAEPGSGKSTQVPWALTQDNSAGRPPGQVLVLQPRRLAARMAAQYVARLHGEKCGGRIGYQVRHENVTGPNTELIYMTEGLLFRMLLGQAHMSHVACVIFDEFHGRSLVGDLILAALLHRRQARGGPAIVIMSATLDVQAVHAILPQAEVMHVPGRQYPVSVTHVAQASNDRLESQVARGVAQVLQQRPTASQQPGGHILTFLPGTAEIDRAAKACAGVAHRLGLRIAPLHASLSPSQQDEAVAPSHTRKLILATNVAETSITIDGVTHVVDSGLAKLAEVDPMTGIGSLQTGAISQAASIQRAGRAGRTGPGHCLRLYTAINMQRRSAHELPEIMRQDLSEAVLWLSAQGLPPLLQLPLINVPSDEAVAQAHITLQRIGALHGETITPLGHELLRMAVHPRLARVVLAAHERGIGPLGCRVAAVLSMGQQGVKHLAQHTGSQQLAGYSDLEVLCSPQALTGEAKQVARGLEASLPGLSKGSAPDDAMERLEEALLHGFSDRLVRRTPPLGARPGPLPLALGWGGKGTLSAQSCVRDSTLMLALAASERGDRAAAVTVDVAHGVTPESLLMLDDGRLLESRVVEVSPQHGRVEKVETLRYDQLVVQEIRSQNITKEQARQALAGWIQSNTTSLISTLTQRADYQQLLARLDSLQPRPLLGPMFSYHAENGDSHADAMSQQIKKMAISLYREAASGHRSSKTLQELDIVELIQQRLSAPWQKSLQNEAPTHVVLPSGRKAAVHYMQGQAPYVASFMQDFFGSDTGPILGKSKRPLTLHLWGPNRQALQVTQDLSNFWRQHYPKLRPALARRYPRHFWPDEPTARSSLCDRKKS